MDSVQPQPQPPNNNYSSQNDNFEMLQSRQLDSAKSEYVDTIRAAGYTIEPPRKKIRRPRKYSYPADDDGSNAAEPTPKRKRRQPGTGKKKLQALGSPGLGFTLHVITITAGEDIASKIMDFSPQGPRTVCIISANGAISNVTLRQSTMWGGTITFEGQFEIISLSGSLSHSNRNGNSIRTRSLSVSMAGLDGQVLGGGVFGMLIAAAPVQVIVGSFIADGKKPKSGSASAPPQNLLNFGAPVIADSGPTSEGA